MNPLKLPIGHESSTLLLSVSGGKDSTALLLAVREAGIPYTAVFADTEWEAKETYEYLETLERLLSIKIHRVGFPGGMRAKIMQRANFPTRMARWCTVELKVQPLDAFAATVKEREQTDVIQAVGIRADESESRAKMLEFEHDESRDIYVWRPLLNWSVSDVITIHHKHGVPMNPLYKRGHNRVGCYPCIYASKEEIRIWAENDPARVSEIRELELAAERLREERNAETPGRYSHSVASFFQSKETRLVDGERVYIPAHVDKVIEWAQTDRGGKQLPLIREEPSGGCFRWGMCEPPVKEGTK